MKHIKYTILFIVCLSLALSFSIPSLWADEPVLNKNEKKSPETQAVQEQVDNKTVKKIEEQRKQILSEATAAIAESKRALKALEETDTKDAIKSLERAVGKMELIMARNPELALAPLDVEVIAYDLYATPGTIRMAIKEAEKLLEDGRVQEARPLIANLASEIVLRTTNIPLATYPDAIKEVVRLLDKQKINEARKVLRNSLNTLVVTTDAVIPLPPIRASYILEEAEDLAEKKDRSAKENNELSGLLQEARSQLEIAELLGYGDAKSFKPMYDQIDIIVKKTEDGKSGEGFFDKIKQKISEFL